MKCEKCNKEHDGSYGSGRFCNSVCARSFSTANVDKKKTKEIDCGKCGRPIVVNIRAPYFTKCSICNPPLARKTPQQRVRSTKVQKWKRKKGQSRKEFILSLSYEELTFETLRERILIEQNNKCSKCNNDSWMGEPLVLELEHKDGNNKNDSRSNIEMLCPNCHSLTKTWRGRNKSKKKKKYITDDDVCVAFLEKGNIRQALLHLGMAAKGGNYARVKRALTMNGIVY
jgi:hypothetical protein